MSFTDSLPRANPTLNAPPCLGSPRPLAQAGNALEDYPAFSKYERNGLAAVLRFYRGGELPPAVLDWAFGLTKQHMQVGVGEAGGPGGARDYRNLVWLLSFAWHSALSGVLFAVMPKTEELAPPAGAIRGLPGLGLERRRQAAGAGASRCALHLRVCSVGSRSTAGSEHSSAAGGGAARQRK